MVRLREQDRAKAAQAAVKELLGSQKDAAAVVQELRGLPARIQSCGLGQTLAFYASKKGYYAQIGSQIARVVSSKSKDTLSLLNEITGEMDGAAYRRATREALALSEWMKRYGVAMDPAKE